MLRQLQALLIAGLLAFSLSSAVADASILTPPEGAPIALAMFADLQDPECARAFAVVSEVAAAHNIPLMMHDFPLPRHNWAFEAAVWARYFDVTSPALGTEFRKFIYANQTQITHDNLQHWVQKFGDSTKASVSLSSKLNDKLAELVNADFNLGQRIGVEHPLTIWVVSNTGVSKPLVDEVKDRAQLNQMIEDMLKKAQPASAAKSALPQSGAAPKKSASKITRKAG
jgi:hypothetical protein